MEKLMNEKNEWDHRISASVTTLSHLILQGSSELRCGGKF